MLKLGFDSVEIGGGANVTFYEMPLVPVDLNEYLEKLEANPERAAVCRRTELCQSIAQNTCDLLSITSFGKDGIPPDEKRGASA